MSEDHDPPRPTEAPSPPGSRPAGRPVVTDKGRHRRREILEAAAAILRESGPQGVTHRAVARRAGCSLSAMTYYFDGLEDLHAEAGAINIERWARRAEHVAERLESHEGPLCRAAGVDAVFAAMDPADEPVLPHYLQLIAAGDSEPVRVAYHAGRDRLNAAVQRILTRIGSTASPGLVIAVVDGAAVTAISEGVPFRPYALHLLDAVI